MIKIEDLKVEDLENAYNGKAGCACGCNGEYVEANDPRAAAILRQVQLRARKAAAGKVEPLHVYEYSTGAVMFAYQTKTRLVRIETKEVSA